MKYIPCGKYLIIMKSYGPLRHAEPAHRSPTWQHRADAQRGRYPALFSSCSHCEPFFKKKTKNIYNLKLEYLSNTIQENLVYAAFQRDRLCVLILVAFSFKC